MSVCHVFSLFGLIRQFQIDENRLLLVKSDECNGKIFNHISECCQSFFSNAFNVSMVIGVCLCITKLMRYMAGYKCCIKIIIEPLFCV